NRRGNAIGGSWSSRTGFRACVTISAPNRQGLKPFSFQTLYGTVETVPHKDFLVAAQALKPVLRFLLDNHLEFGGDSVDQLHRDWSFADDLDGLVELDAALVNLEALGL